MRHNCKHQITVWLMSEVNIFYYKEYKIIFVY